METKILMSDETDTATENKNKNYVIEDTLSTADFNKLSRFIQTNYGVKMPEQKKLMLQCRLKKRLKVLNMRTFKKYLEYVFHTENTDEIQNMIDVVTTHKTDFFREKEHFDFITGTVLPKLTRHRMNQKIKLFSAGCSTGEEPYTMVISLLEEKSKGVEFEFEISACDVSAESIKTAKTGIYPLAKTDQIPMDIKKKYFLKNADPQKKLVKVVPHLQSYVNFFTLNLLEEKYKINDTYDIILCRNTLIYFNREVQEQVLSQLCKKLKPHGYLIIGHSESIIGMRLPLNQIKPTIFQKTF
jgi:chemotaxis protein methyltransferase CheR